MEDAHANCSHDRLPSLTCPGPRRVTRPRDAPPRAPLEPADPGRRNVDEEVAAGPHLAVHLKGETGMMVRARFPKMPMVERRRSRDKGRTTIFVFLHSFFSTIGTTNEGRTTFVPRPSDFF